MLKFLIGYIVGGIMGFLICAVLSINNTEKESASSAPVNNDAGDNGVGN